MRASSFLLVGIGVSSVGGVGCIDRTVTTLEPSQAVVETMDIPAQPFPAADILFVIDNSGSMKEEQDSLKANFGKMMQVLETLDGGMPDVHIGVVTSDLGTSTTDGATAAASFGCSGKGDDGAMHMTPTVTGRFIADNGKGTHNYSGTLDDAFAALADVGTRGCGIEQHLGAMQRGFENPANSGFVRDAAYLAVVVIADEDDCSLAHDGLFASSTMGAQVNFACTSDGVVCDSSSDMTTPGDRTQCHPSDHAKWLQAPARYASFVRGVKRDPRDVVVAGIVGDPTPVKIGDDGLLAPSCTYNAGAGTADQTAFPAVRTASFLAQFGLYSKSSICGADLKAGMTQIGALLKHEFGDPCFKTDLADADPATPELDPDCTVTDVLRVSSGDDVEVAAIPSCKQAPGAVPCWHIDEDAVKCAYTMTNPHRKLVIDRGGVVPGADLHVRASCVGVGGGVDSGGSQL
jgi:hypothetical protein